MVATLAAGVVDARPHVAGAAVGCDRGHDRGRLAAVVVRRPGAVGWARGLARRLAGGAVRGRRDRHRQRAATGLMAADGDRPHLWRIGALLRAARPAAAGIAPWLGLVRDLDRRAGHA